MRRNLLILTAAVAVVGLAVAFWSTRPPPPAPRLPELRLAWTFEAPQPGYVAATPLITADSIFLAVGHTHPSRESGAVYAINPATGKTKWTYDADGAMLATVSSPVLAGDRLFLGEGLHGNSACRLHCLDSHSGQAKWTFPTGDHIEGGPTVADGLVIFPAGNDGLYALDTDSGTPKWNFRADLHIDSTPFVVDGRVYVGSGLSRQFPTFQVACLDLKTGNPIWRTPVKLPAWGSPVVAGDHVFVGLGNGRLTEPVQPPESPAGALACFDARTGAERWTFPVADAVFGRPLVVGDRVVFGARDGNLYGVTFDGREAFRIPMGGPVMAPPTADANRVYAVAVPGRVVCVNPADGREVWRYELSQRGARPQVYAGPQVVGGRLFVAGEMITGPVWIVCLHCFDLPSNDTYEKESP